MNFRICRKCCGMDRLEVAAFNYACDSASSFIRFEMTGKRHHCVFSVDGWEFSKPFSEKMGECIDRGLVKRTCGHDFEPAFVTKRHVPVLDGVDIAGFRSGFFDGEHVDGCRYCDLQVADSIINKGRQWARQV